MKVFTSVPFLRIILPFVTGILFAINFSFPQVPKSVFLFLLSLLAISYASKKVNSRLRIVFLILADIFLVLFGAQLVQQKNIKNHPTFYGHYIHADSSVTMIGVINELPVKKERTTKCEMEITKIVSVAEPVTGKLIAYFKNCDVSGSLQPGSVVVFRSQPNLVSKPLNPFEFDYRTYLSNKQVLYTAFVDSLDFKTLQVESNLNRVWLFGLSCKKILLSRLRNSELRADAYGICAALLTGYDDEIDKNVMTAFSHSGTLHVLSVSGLHTGLIYLMLSYLLDFFDKNKRYRLSRLVIITIVLWLFALITGFSAPVLRAVIMFNLLGVGKTYFRSDYRNQLNVLLVSAFILLCYNVYFITDIGFLLSYFAMIGLIYYQPKIAALWEPDQKAINYLWQSCAASVAATLSTLPLTLFYFKQFPFWFIICNIVVVPATFLILILTVLVVVKVSYIASLINLIIDALIKFIGIFDKEGIGFYDRIHFYFADMIFLSFLILASSYAIQVRSFRMSIVSIAFLITWQINSLYTALSLKLTGEFLVYQVKKSSAYSIKSKGHLQLNNKDSSSYAFHIKPNITSYNISTIKEKTFNSISHKDRHILILNKKDHWPQHDISKTTCIVLSNNFLLTEADLPGLPALKTVVSDASNNNYAVNKTSELSRKFGFALHNTKTDGAFLLALNETTDW